MGGRRVVARGIDTSSGVPDGGAERGGGGVVAPKKARGPGSGEEAPGWQVSGCGVSCHI